MRIKNKTPATLKELGTEISATYGPDGKEAPMTFSFNDDTTIDGKIVKGTAKTGTYRFLIPEKWWVRWPWRSAAVRQLRTGFGGLLRLLSSNRSKRREASAGESCDQEGPGARQAGPQGPR